MKAIEDAGRSATLAGGGFMLSLGKIVIPFLPSAQTAGAAVLCSRHIHLRSRCLRQGRYRQARGQYAPRAAARWVPSARHLPAQRRYSISRRCRSRTGSWRGRPRQSPGRASKPSSIATTRTTASTCPTSGASPARRPPVESAPPSPFLIEVVHRSRNTADL